MKPNFTSINIVLDRSGSMKRLSNDTIGGFNTFLADQRKVEGEAVFTLATFSSDYTLVHDCVPLKNVSDLTVEKYQPSGYTALLDALGRTINATGIRLAAMKEEDRPSQVIFVVITDGEENYSREFTREKVFEMISHQREKYSWEFVFLGCTSDQIKGAVHLGVTAANSFAYTADSAGVASSYNSISSNMTAYRSSGAKQVDFFKQTPTDLISKGDVVVPSITATPSIITTPEPTPIIITTPEPIVITIPITTLK